MKKRLSPKKKELWKGIIFIMILLGSVSFSACEIDHRDEDAQEEVSDNKGQSSNDDENESGSDWVKCLECHGSGKCSRCGGSGRSPRHPEYECARCDGSGVCPVCHGNGGWND